MPLVIILDQKASRESGDRVAAWAAELNGRHSADMLRNFVRSAGDELQALLRSPEALVDIVIESLEDAGWWIGIGAGPVDRLGETARDSQGPAFWHARQAVDAAKKRSKPQPVAVMGEPADDANALNDALAALAFILTRRSPEQRETMRLLRTGMKSKDIATQLGVTPAAISQRLRAAGAEEEAGLRRLVTRIASEFAGP